MYLLVMLSTEFGFFVTGGTKGSQEIIMGFWAICHLYKAYYRGFLTEVGVFLLL